MSLMVLVSFVSLEVNGIDFDMVSWLCLFVSHWVARVVLSSLKEEALMMEISDGFIRIQL